MNKLDEENFVSNENTNWSNISAYRELSENFIRGYKDRVDWKYISGRQNLSESFIREFKDRVHWHYISSGQKLSEDFIREFQNKVDWSNIFEYQNLSNAFRKEFPYTKWNEKNVSNQELPEIVELNVEELEVNEKFLDVSQREINIII